jgi:putative ABC transport system permease protein
MFDSLKRTIVGVVKDFNFTSLKETIEPLIITCRRNNNNLVIKVAGSSPAEAAAAVEKNWNAFHTGYPPEMRFLDDVLQRMYSAEHSQGKVFSILSAVSITIASLGIFGLASYMAVQRRKEIGIRKILGGSVTQIGFLLIKDLLILVIVAAVIAVPVCYFGLEKWSQTFAYRTTLSFDIFVTGILSVVALAFIIVAYNAAKTAMESPVKSLRSE